MMSQTPTRPMPTLREQLLRRKPIVFQHQHHVGEELARNMTTFQLMMFGVGATVGTGIFFVLGEAVPKAGPAVVVSFVIAGIAAGLSALCYAELASAIPVSGSTMDAMDWHRRDVLVIGSSSTGAFSQIFLGSSAAKIVRHAPVPVIVVP